MKNLYVVERTMSTAEWKEFFNHFNGGFDEQIKRYRTPIFAEIVNKMGENVAKCVILHFNLTYDDEFECYEGLLRFVNMYYQFMDVVRDDDPFGMRVYCEKTSTPFGTFGKLADAVNLNWLEKADLHDCWQYLAKIHYLYLDNIVKKNVDKPTVLCENQISLRVTHNH